MTRKEGTTPGEWKGGVVRVRRSDHEVLGQFHD